MQQVFISPYKDEDFNPHGLENELVEILDIDEKTSFVDFMRQKSRIVVPECWQRCAFSRMFRWGAVRCASALLNGETPFSLDVNSEVIAGKYPLHLAAHDLCYGMVDLLIRHGARTNIITRDTPYTRGNLLPLNIGTEMISHHPYLISWRPSDSIFKLLLILCLPQLKVPLDNCRLLALHTKEVGEVFVEYLMKGKLVEMAGLLMVARDKIIASSFNCSNIFPHPAEGITVKDVILLLMTGLNKEEIQLPNVGQNSEMLQIAKSRNIMKNALLLLEVFEKVGNKIEEFIHMPRSHMPKGMLIKHVKELIENGGFVLEDRDINLSDIECERKDICEATEFLEKETPFLPLQCDRVPFSQDKIRPVWETRDMISWSLRTIFPYHRYVLSPYYSPALGHPRQKSRTPVIDSSVLQSARRSASMLLAAKKVMRHL